MLGGCGSSIEDPSRGRVGEAARRLGRGVLGAKFRGVAN